MTRWRRRTRRSRRYWVVRLMRRRGRFRFRSILTRRRKKWRSSRACSMMCSHCWRRSWSSWPSPSLIRMFTSCMSMKVLESLWMTPILMSTWLSFNSSLMTFSSSEERPITSQVLKFMQKHYFWTNWLQKSSRKKFM